MRERIWERTWAERSGLGEKVGSREGGDDGLRRESGVGDECLAEEGMDTFALCWTDDGTIGLMTRDCSSFDMVVSSQWDRIDLIED